MKVEEKWHSEGLREGREVTNWPIMKMGTAVFPAGLRGHGTLNSKCGAVGPPSILQKGFLKVIAREGDWTHSME